MLEFSRQTDRSIILGNKRCLDMQFCIVQQGGGGEVNGLYVQTEINTNTLPAFPLPTARTV